MKKIIVPILFVFLVVSAKAQTNISNIPNKAISGNDDEFETLLGKSKSAEFNTQLIYPGVVCLAGAGLFVFGSESKNNGNYGLTNGYQIAGASIFVVGAVIYAIIATPPKEDRLENRKKRVKSVNPSDWENAK